MADDIFKKKLLAVSGLVNLVMMIGTTILKVNSIICIDPLEVLGPIPFGICIQLVSGTVWWRLNGSLPLIIV